MIAKEMMTSPAITVTVDLSVPEVAQVMRDNTISGVPVVDAAGQLLGVVTELNLIKRNAPLFGPSYYPIFSGLIPTNIGDFRRYREQLRQILATTAGELMDHVNPISTTDDLETIIQRMEQPEVTMLPVVEQGKIVGVVTRTDLVRLIEKLEIANDSPEAELLEQ